jgi:putative flippase GtrA
VLRTLNPTTLMPQSLRYLVVGGSMALLNAVLVWTFHAAGLYGFVSSFLSGCCVIVPTVLLHRYFTFGVKGPLLAQAMGTVAIAASNVPIGMLTVFVLVDVLEWNAFISSLIATAIAAVLNYTVFARFVFKKRAT